MLICYYLAPGELYTYKISLLLNIIAHNNTHQPPQHPQTQLLCIFQVTIDIHNPHTFSVILERKHVQKHTFQPQKSFKKNTRAFKLTYFRFKTSLFSTSREFHFVLNELEIRLKRNKQLKPKNRLVN